MVSVFDIFSKFLLFWIGIFFSVDSSIILQRFNRINLKICTKAKTTNELIYFSAAKVITMH